MARPTLHLLRREDSRIDGATKLLLETAAGERIETVVLRIRSGRSTLCVSSQVGCAAGCVFCATARIPRVRPLTRHEILGQVDLARPLLESEGRALRNVVFMGMGEPLHNEAEVTAAVDSLLSPRGYGLAGRFVTVSTIGMPDGMKRLARRFPRLRLALSLHTVDEELRRRLIPAARHHPLPALRQAVVAVNELQGAPVLIEALMLAGLTDDDASARAMAAWLDGLNVRVNLIPYNPAVPEESLRESGPERVAAFAGVLREAGFEVTCRASLGRDIAAACGQLAG